MNNLLVILPGELIPSAEIRLLNVFRRMSDVRFSTVELSRGLTRDFEDRIKDADIVVFQRNRDINSKHILDFCLSIDKIVVFDIDDDLLSIPNVSNTPTTGEMNRILGYFLRNSSHVTTSTERLKERYFSFNSRIRVIENTIDTNKWCVRSRRRDNGETRMLLANTDYFKLLDFRKSFVDVLRVILADETTKLYIIGVVPSHRLLSEKNVYFYEQIWGYDKYLKKVSDFDIDIALVPLEDMEFHSSKSLIKYIDYSALGIPGIYSNVLPYKGSVMKHMDNCLLVDNVYDDWHKAIRNLVDDRALRERLRERSFKTVRENYDISRAVKEWRAFIDELKKTKGSLYIPSGEGEPSGEAERFKRQFSVFERQYYNPLHLKAAFVAKKLRRFPHLKKSLSYIYYGFLRVLDVARELNRLFSHGHREEKMTIPVKLMESLKLFQDKSGLEVGGPSVFFKYIYPLYSVVGSLDNVDYRVEANGQGKSKEEFYFGFDLDKRRGDQYVAEATDLRVFETGKYDFVISCHTLEHVANPLKAIEEFLRIIKKQGFLVIVVPDKRYTFDHRRNYTNMRHLVSDFKNEVQEDDTSHLKEILQNHDIGMDPEAGTRQQFIARSLKNLENRCLHHHVFNRKLLRKIADYFKLKKIFVDDVLSSQLIGVFQKQ